MFLKVHELKLTTGRPVAILNEEAAKELNVHVNERVSLKKTNFKKNIVAIVDISKDFTDKGVVIVSKEVIDILNVKKDEVVEVSAAQKPLSVNYILKKLNGKELNYTEIFAIISDIVENKLSEAEIAYFVSAVYLRKMSINETIDLTRAIVQAGKILNFDHRKIIADKHCIGGLAGNRTTPIVTSIIAAAIDKYKLKAVMPKTSSRAISSAAGTADVIETIANVEFSMNRIKDILEKANACLVWGGTIGLAPADDKIIQVERLLSLDPESQLIASILAKKISVGSTHILIDIPFGSSAKISTENDAKKLKEKFEKVAKAFKLNLRVILTNGDQPIGNGIGPLLELRDVLAVLNREKNAPLDLENKVLLLSTELLSLISNISKNKARQICLSLLESKMAYKSFQKIIEAQGGNFKTIGKKLELAKFKTTIVAEHTGKIEDISSKKLSALGRMAGAPESKKAGIFLHRHLNDYVRKNDPLFDIYSENKEKLNYAADIAKRINPVKIKVVK
uniref:AMP phosphorylase n=1 Tax=uncultured Candidatus Pacearchaeota archaeon TaxID=2109283 RepID=A0A447ITY0_9ARCH|nr:AMP phosphorylase [uncultured Candidatus Pacearchaeota archaeon]